jgi:predicted PurR-regulated permease PerM
MLGIDERALRIAWTIFLFALLLAIVYYIRSTILLFAGAIFFAYMLAPVVALMTRYVSKRQNLALAIVYSLFIGVLVLLGFELIPRLASEAMSLLTKLPSLVSGGQLTQLPLPKWLEPMRTQLIATLNKEATNLQASAVPVLQQMGTRILNGLSQIVPAILVPILAFFFLKDAAFIRKSLLGTVEDGQDRTTLSLILDDVHEVLRNYIRALVLLSVAAFCAWAIFLSVLQYPYELLLAGLAGLLEFIPVVGPAAALVIMCLVLIVSGSHGVLWIVIFWACFRIFQDYVLNPYLMSSGIELHPLLILFGVLAGEDLGGIPGMFFSIPLLAILRVGFNHLKKSHTRRTLSSTVVQRTVHS